MSDVRMVTLRFDIADSINILHTLHRAGNWAADSLREGLPEDVQEALDASGFYDSPTIPQAILDRWPQSDCPL